MSGRFRLLLSFVYCYSRVFCTKGACRWQLFIVSTAQNVLVYCVSYSFCSTPLTGYRVLEPNGTMIIKTSVLQRRELNAAQRQQIQVDEALRAPV